MRAVIQRRYGGPDTLALGDLADPTPKRGEVAIHVLASIVHQGNVLIRSGEFPALFWLPMRLMIGLRGPRKPVPGTVFSGRVQALGEGVDNFEVGQDIVGVNTYGAHAETLVMSAGGTLAPMPEGLTHAEAASVPYGVVTARYFLHNLGELEPDQRVLVIGASGGVGQAAVQVALAARAHVTAVCRPETADFVRSLGAHELVDRKRTPVTELDERFDILLDTAGVCSFPQHAHLLTPTGRLLAVQADAQTYWWAWKTRKSNGRRILTGIFMGNPEELAASLEMAVSGSVRPRVAATYPLEDIAEAHRLVEGGAVPGSVILEPGFAS